MASLCALLAHLLRVEAHRAMLLAAARTPSLDSIARAAEASLLVVALLAHLRVEAHRAVLLATARTPSLDSIARAAEAGPRVFALLAHLRH